MKTGEALTRATIWLALLGYFIATILALRRRLDLARVFWTMGCLVYIAHVASAFHFYHGWSHADAYNETARQTAEVTGSNWGGGIYINYLFTLMWIGDAMWWWANRAKYEVRPRWVNGVVHGIFLFMIFNGTVVFGHGPVRWLGLAGVLIVASAFLRRIPRG